MATIFRPPGAAKIQAVDSSAAIRSQGPPGLFPGLKDTLFGGPDQPLANYDWPVPKGRAFPITNLTWTWSLNQVTMMTAELDRPLGIFRTWAVDSRVAVKSQAEQRNTALLTFVPPATNPFQNFDWPVPK